MLNDIVLSGLINMFALLGAEGGGSPERGRNLLGDYLRHHFGLRNAVPYLDLYSDLRALYDSTEGIDTSTMLANICGNLRAKTAPEELTLVYLRLMEFCHAGARSSEWRKPAGSLTLIAHHLGVDSDLMDDFSAFVYGKDDIGNVRIHNFDGYAGDIRTLWIERFRILVFKYEGSDNVLFDDMPLPNGIFRIWERSSVLKNRRGAPLYYSSVYRPYADTSTRNVVFCGKNINFRFPGSDNGIHNLSFSLHSGELVAIMGGSGTGKTTLLSLLNGSIRPQEGSISVNGNDISDYTAGGLLGFVPQDDLLIEELTVYENLMFTARLCFDGMSENELRERVDKVLSDLCLDHARDLVVGSPLNKTISGGQRKRLNIALELVREPAVLLLDEPTSGLSSSDTENVMGLLKDQTGEGRLIIVNIHQPSSDVYKLFDRLWLLDKGGYPVYDGNPVDAITYFKTAAGYADSDTSACPVCGNLNPEIVLNIIDEKTMDNTGRTGLQRKTTPEQWHEGYLGMQKETQMPERSPLPQSGQKKPGAFKQFRIFLERNIRTKLTNLQYILITALEAPVLALVCAALTHFAEEGGYTVMDNRHLVSYFFMAVIVATFLGMSSSAEEIIRDRAILKREKFLSLSYHSYIWSKICYSAMVSLAQTALFVLVGNTVMGLHGMFFMWWMILFITSVLSNLIGLLLSQTLNSVVSIYITIPILLIPQILLCGLVVPFSDLGKDSTTDNVPLIGDLIPSRWAFEAAAVGTFMYNAYEKPYFEYDRARYEAFFFSETYVWEMESQLETMLASGDNSRMDIIRNSLPRLEEVCGIEYDGDFSYESLKGYFSTARASLSRTSNSNTLEKDRLMGEFIQEYGSDALLKLKKDNYNLQLEKFTTGAGASEAVRIIKGHIVPKAGAIFLTPVSRNGRAPFYSSSKRLGNLEIPTLWFNTIIMAFMSILLIFALLLNIKETITKQNKYRNR